MHGRTRHRRSPDSELPNDLSIRNKNLEKTGVLGTILVILALENISKVYEALGYNDGFDQLKGYRSVSHQRRIKNDFERKRSVGNAARWAEGSTRQATKIDSGNCCILYHNALSFIFVTTEEGSFPTRY